MFSGAGAIDPVQANTLRFITGLSFLTVHAHVGQPYGEGAGLEVSPSIARTTFDSLDAVREGGFRLAISLITNDSPRTDDVSGVMGAGALDTSGPTPDQTHAARDLGGAATFLGQINRDGDTIWELWKRNDEVAEELLCWLAGAWGRLETTGKVEPLNSVLSRSSALEELRLHPTGLAMVQRYNHRIGDVEWQIHSAAAQQPSAETTGRLGARSAARRSDS